MLDETLEHPPEDRGEALPQLAAGATLGHFRIVRELGEGGMGVVFEAHDAALDRSVAIKLVRDRSAGSAAGDRLIREAQAMAKLAHPNVIPVHEVDTVDGRVYVVMELVRGETLEAWLAQPRTWREIVRAFVQAGEGLAAAHRAGMVHRDFKPSNVLVDRAGHVRVGDFGLARDDGDSPPTTARLADGSNRTRPVGTPAYMAPEQRAGEPVDARADQYSFAISLERALAGRRVPRRIRTALARALRADRDDRFPLIDGLLDELRLALDSRRRAVVVISTGVAVAAITTALAAWLSRPAADDCADSASLVDRVWNQDARDAVLQRFAAVRPNAAQATTSATAVVDKWAMQWSLGRRSACRADTVHRAPRLSCLDRNLAELHAQVATWRTADAEVADRSLAAAMALPDPSSCANQTATATAPDAAAITARIAAINAANHAGHGASVKAELPSLITSAGHDPALLGPALLAAAGVELDLGDLANAREHATRAAIESGRAGDDDTMWRATVMQSAIATEQGRPRDGLGLLDAADAMLARAHIDSPYSIALARGDALTEAGQSQDAIALLTRLATELEPRAGSDPGNRRELAKVLGSLATAYTHAFRYDKARELLLRTLEIESSLLGPDHPELGKTLHDLGADEARLEQWDAAFAHEKQAREVFVKAHGEHSVLVVVTDLTVAGFEIQRGNDEKARPIFERVRRELDGLVAPDHPYIANVEEALGSIERDEDHCDKAILHFEAELVINDKAGRDGSIIGLNLTNLGACYADVGRWAEARKAIERARIEYGRAQVPPDEMAETLATLADIEAHDGHRSEAIALAKHVIEALDDSKLAAAPLLQQYEREQLATWTK